MCNKCKSKEYAGLHKGHLKEANKVFPNQKDFNKKLFDAMTKFLNPHHSFYSSLLAVRQKLEQKDFGILQQWNLVRLPLSIIGSNKVRYRTPVVENLHESILSGHMSDLMKNEIDKVLKLFDLKLVYLCCCGVVLGKSEDIDDYYGSTEHINLELLRSAIDAEGNPVVSISDFSKIEVLTMDLHVNDAENRLFSDIEFAIKQFSKAGFPDYDLESDLNFFIQNTFEHHKPQTFEQIQKTELIVVA
ncbi:hypothetical protein CSB11_00445 [Candidatus Campbellbacteria bacterium]|nr:MAG: hypothetical protein CSB11_00445 [Candidatus Campbellbacteria bacterium]